MKLHTITARALMNICVSMRMSDNRVSHGSQSILMYIENVQEVTSLVVIIFCVIHWTKKDITVVQWL